MPRTENTKKFSEEQDAIDFANTVGKNNVQDIIEDKGLWVVLYYVDVREEGEEKLFEDETVVSKIVAELNEEPEEEKKVAIYDGKKLIQYGLHNMTEAEEQAKRLDIIDPDLFEYNPTTFGYDAGKEDLFSEEGERLFDTWSVEEDSSIEPEEEDEFVLDEDELEMAEDYIGDVKEVEVCKLCDNPVSSSSDHYCEKCIEGEARMIDEKQGQVDPFERLRGATPPSPEDLKKAGIIEIIDDVQDWGEAEELTPEEAEDVLEEVQDKMELDKIMMIEDPVERFQALGYDVQKIFWVQSSGSVIGESDMGDPLATGAVDTGRRFITKKVDDQDKFIASVSHRYALLPNEVMADVGDRVAAMVGAKLHEDRSDEKRLYRYYIDDSFPCGPLNADDEGELFPGFLVYNSVDGSMGAGIEPFLYRVVCDNGMMIQMKTAMTLKARHTQGVHDFQRDDFVEMAKNALELSKAIAEVQTEWVSIDLSLEENSAIVDRLVFAQIPNAYKDECPYLKKPSKRLLEENIPAIPKGTSLWTAYNHLTAAITRPPNDKKVDERTRVDYQHYLHKALMPELQVES